MKKQIHIAVLFGGRSAEHEVSLRSAQNVIDALDRKKYKVTLIGIDKRGRWLLGDTKPQIPTGGREIMSISDSEATAGPIDVVFPILHGPYGEDGTVQGLLKLAGIPFVGPSVLGSAVGMDKDVTKRLLRDAGIPIAKFVVLASGEKIATSKIIAELGLPLFVKPANLGSSVGVTKVERPRDLVVAIVDALKYDRKVLVEEYVPGREIECSVLGNEQPSASLPGEIIPHDTFYSYRAKYIDENGATLKIPAKLSAATTKKIQQLAVKTFKALCCEGMARVDFFLRKNGEIVVSEINTIPGFTSISMYPKLWETSGLSYGKLVDTLIELAIERFKKEQKLLMEKPKVIGTM